jgi:hypothetical protein
VIPRTGNPTGTPSLIVAIACGFSAPLARAQDPTLPAAKLTVVAQARPTTCYVGQTVELSVGVVAERERPQVTGPKVEGAEVVFVRVEQVPLGASGIGDQVWEKNLFRFRYRIVPRRAATLTVPRVSARLGERMGSSDPVRLAVREVPRAGRPAGFLGGVGRFDVEAAVTPESVWTGASLDYRVTITGPGARGVTAAPGLERLASLPLGLRVERLPDVTMADPPAHTFVFRLRPTRAGDATLPPVAVAGFDPITGQFPTKVTTGVRLRVSDVAPFDAARLDYGPRSTTSSSATRVEGQLTAIVAAFLALIAAGAVVVVVGRRHRTGRAARRVLRGAARRLGRSSNEVERGRAITEGLAAFLRLTTGRPPGALTPAEAGDGVARATGNDDLALRARQMIARCDRARFGHDELIQADSLRNEGDRFFADLACEALGSDAARPDQDRKA